MKKTKTQAQKREERELKMQERKAEALKQKELRAQMFQKQRQAQQLLVQPSKMFSDDEKARDHEEEELIGSQSDTIPNFSSCCIEEEGISCSPSLQEVRIAKEQAALSLMQERDLPDVAPSRVVQNHSTYCAGLKPVLIRLQKLLPKCTIIPGALSQGEDHCEEFTLRIQRAIDTTAYKLVARNGYTSQDVIISTEGAMAINEESLIGSIATALESKALREDVQEPSSEICTSVYNREMHKGRQDFWREEHHAKHEKVKQHEQELKLEQKIEEQRRKLATKRIDRDQIEKYAKRDVAIISGDKRGKMSMHPKKAVRTSGQSSMASLIVTQQARSGIMGVTQSTKLPAGEASEAISRP
jgi:hypothetical protein